MTLREMMNDDRFSGCTVYDNYRGIDHASIIRCGKPTALCERHYGCVLDIECVLFMDFDKLCVMALVCEAADNDPLDEKYLFEKLHQFLYDAHGLNNGYPYNRLFDC